MAYILGQYNHNKEKQKNWIQCLKKENCQFTMVYSKAGQDNLIPFEDTALQLVASSNGKNNVFILGQTYYCHCKIRREQEHQKITMKLINFINNDIDANEEDENYEQYIKIINIQEGNGQWVDIQFTFTPQGNDFNTILFNLARTNSDYVSTPRKTMVICLELGVINNITDIFPVNEGRLLLKIGVQSRPGLRMVINREEIYTGRTGVYEIKDGEIKINFISMIAPSIDINEEELTSIIPNTNAAILFDRVPEVRTFDSFTIDYIYEE